MAVSKYGGLSPFFYGYKFGRRADERFPGSALGLPPLLKTKFASFVQSCFLVLTQNGYTRPRRRGISNVRILSVTCRGAFPLVQCHAPTLTVPNSALPCVTDAKTASHSHSPTMGRARIHSSGQELTTGPGHAASFCLMNTTGEPGHGLEPLKHCRAYGASFAQIFAEKGQDGSQNYDVIREATSGRFFTKVAFSAKCLICCY